MATNVEQNYQERILKVLIYIQNNLDRELSLVQISERSGYDTQQSFHRAFKEAYNTTPKEFRDNAAEQMAALQKKQTHLENKHCDVMIKTIDPINVAFIRHVGSYNNV